MSLGAGDRLGTYEVLARLGEGGMGEVWRARDGRDGRDVAIKTLRAELTDRASRERLLREARIGAGLDHPRVCRVLEIGEAPDGSTFIVMELLAGETLTDRLRGGPIPLGALIPIALEILDGLAALHAIGVVHRDLKPSNVFLAPGGVKLLDLGLARPVSLSGSGDDVEKLTVTGAIVGTPRYMAPEQVLGQPVDARTDLFALGAILFEMASGRPAFGGGGMMGILHAVLHQQPPALGGSLAITALDRVIRSALAKQPEDRPASAAALAADLRQLVALTDVGEGVTVRPMSRLVVLPFRLLRPDPDLDFLPFGLADALTAALSSLPSLVVRASLLAARLADLDPKAIAKEAEVDLALTGTLLSSGDQLRVTTQLVEVPAGTVVLTHTVQATRRDVFQVQDELTQRIVESLALPLTDREARMLRRDVPASPLAHELLLRGNQAAAQPGSWSVARDLYRRAVEEDPRYAPAWARLARCHWRLGKFGRDGEAEIDAAEEALRRALDLNPDLPMAHHLAANMELALGRSLGALRRLLSRARSGQQDPELFAGLVAVCRFCGLLDESLAAHAEARRLDPQIVTSLCHTLFMRGDFERAFATGDSLGFLDALALSAMGREAEALGRLALDEASFQPMMVAWRGALRAALEGRRDDVVRVVAELVESFRDPEAHFYGARLLARVGETDRALDVLERVVGTGFVCEPIFRSDPWLDPLRDAHRFEAVLADADAGRRRAAAVFEEEGGPRLLGLHAVNAPTYILGSAPEE